MAALGPRYSGAASAPGRHPGGVRGVWGRGWSGVANSTGSRAVGLAGDGPRGGPDEAREILAGT